MESFDSAGKIGKIAKWFGVISLIITPLIFTPFTLDPSLMPRTFFWTLSLIAFSIIIYRLSNKKEMLFDFSILKRLMFPLLLSYFIITSVSFFAAQNKIEAVNEILRIIPFIIFTIIASILFSNYKEYFQFLTKLVIVFALVHSLIGLSEILIVLKKTDLSHTVTYYISGLSAHRNLYSQTLLFCLPFTIYGVNLFKKLWRILAVISSVLVLILIIVLLVKSVWMAFAISILISFLFFINYFSHFGIKTRIFGKIGLYFAGIIGIIAIAVLSYAKLDSWETIDKQADWIRNYRFGSSLERLDLWEKSMDIYRDQPIRGIGAGNWKIILPSYGTDGLRSEQGVVNFIRPHNDFVGMLTETGIFGFIIYLSIFLTLFYYVYKVIKSSASKDNKLLMLIMMGGLVFYIIISLLSFPKERVEHSMFLGIYIVIITIIYHKVFPVEKVKTLKNRSVLFYSVLVLLLLSLTSFYFRSISEYHLRKAFSYREDSDWKSMVSESEKAVNLFSVMDNTAVPIAWYTGSGYFNMGDYDKAFIEFDKAFKYHPNNIHVLNNLAGCYEIKGDHTKAIELYSGALKISSVFEDAKINLTAVYYNLGDIDNAYKTLKTIAFSSMDKRYDKSISLISRRLMSNIIIDDEDRDMKVSLDRINNDPVWIKKVFGQSLEKKTDFDTQVCEEAIYLMEFVDFSITEKRAKELKEKYLKRG